MSEDSDNTEPKVVVSKSAMLEHLMLKLGPGGTLHLAHLLHELSTAESKDAETWRLVRNAFLAANEASVGTVLGALALLDLDPQQPATTNFGRSVREIMCFRLAEKASESIKSLDPARCERIKQAVKVLREVFADSTVHIPVMATPSRSERELTPL